MGALLTGEGGEVGPGPSIRAAPGLQDYLDILIGFSSWNLIPLFECEFRQLQNHQNDPLASTIRHQQSMPFFQLVSDHFKHGVKLLRK